MFTPLAPYGVTMIGSGVGSLIGGHVSEALGGSYEVGSFVSNIAGGLGGSGVYNSYQNYSSPWVTVDSTYTNTVVSKRDELLNAAQNTKLRNTINELYRPTATVGDGGTAAKLIDEFKKGETLTHLSKVQERIVNLQNIIAKQNLSSEDLTIANELLNDLVNAVKFVSYT